MPKSRNRYRAMLSRTVWCDMTFSDGSVTRMDIREGERLFRTAKDRDEWVNLMNKENPDCAYPLPNA